MVGRRINLTLSATALILSTPAHALTIEYEVPLIQADGKIGRITVEDHQPEKGVLVLTCTERPPVLKCVTDENGKPGTLEVPMAQPKPDLGK